MHIVHVGSFISFIFSVLTRQTPPPEGHQRLPTFTMTLSASLPWWTANNRWPHQSPTSITPPLHQKNEETSAHWIVTTIGRSVPNIHRCAPPLKYKIDSYDQPQHNEASSTSTHPHTPTISINKDLHLWELTSPALYCCNLPHTRIVFLWRLLEQARGVTTSWRARKEESSGGGSNFTMRW
jgi:hypothetical protein